MKCSSINKSISYLALLSGFFIFLYRGIWIKDVLKIPMSKNYLSTRKLSTLRFQSVIWYNMLRLRQQQSQLMEKRWSFSIRQKHRNTSFILGCRLRPNFKRIRIKWVINSKNQNVTFKKKNQQTYLHEIKFKLIKTEHINYTIKIKQTNKLPLLSYIIDCLCK